jgi:hypothetical protein
MRFWIVRKGFPLTVATIVGMAFVGALSYSPSVNPDTSATSVKRVRTIAIKPSPDSGVTGSALAERKEGELSKGILDLLYRHHYRQ